MPASDFFIDSAATGRGKAARMRAVLALLQQSAHSLAQIATLVGVTTRTSMRDLKSLKRAGIPVMHRRSAGYSVEGGCYFTSLWLSTEESRAILHGLQLSSFKPDGALPKVARLIAHKLKLPAIE